MSKIVILVVEDEAEVRDAIVRDLKPYSDVFRIEPAEDVDDAKQVIMESEADGDRVGLVLCDHILPGMNGVDYLIELTTDPKRVHLRKVLITGQAGLEDTIAAVNKARLDHYIEKPWEPENLQNVVKDELTEYVLTQEDPLLPYVSLLDGQKLMEAISHRRSDR